MGYISDATNCMPSYRFVDFLLRILVSQGFLRSDFSDGLVSEVWPEEARTLWWGGISYDALPGRPDATYDSYVLSVLNEFTPEILPGNVSMILLLSAYEMTLPFRCSSEATHRPTLGKFSRKPIFFYSRKYACAR
jgi:hypothetical protein